MTNSEVEKLMKDKINATFEIALRHAVTGIVKDTIQDELTADFDDHRKESRQQSDTS